MLYELERMIQEARSVLDMWEFLAKRTPFNEENGANAWNEELAKERYGTWKDEDGEEQTCLSVAEETMAKLIVAAESLIKDYERQLQHASLDRQNAQRNMERTQGFASMSDRALGQYMEEYVRNRRKEEGEEELVYVPEWLEYVAARLQK